MNYKEIQRQKAVRLRNELFRDPGEGVYKKLQREFVLSAPELNLWSGIREDALAYYSDNGITWWDSGDEPTGHLLSSQIACINHLCFLRQRADLSTLLLKGTDSTIQKAIVIDSGFVEFEKVGTERLGGEKLLTRGANCTSVDALMLGENIHGKKILFLIEWKYTESYTPDSKLKGEPGKQRWETYIDLLKHEECPIEPRNFENLYYEPFYQLLKLSWNYFTKMVPFCLNRTPMGLKQRHFHAVLSGKRCLNRTLVGLKLSHNYFTKMGSICLNRTLVGLKHQTPGVGRNLVSYKLNLCKKSEDFFLEWHFTLYLCGF